MAQTIPEIMSSTSGVQRAPGPTPDDPLAAKLIAIDPSVASFVESYNAELEAFYNRPTTYLQVINGYCVAAPMTERQFFSLTRR
ncbi:hypothetical protein WJ32_01390 [Burkholderia ubonensis]|uniref:Uncharacterized protein n=2 Tax=Burkholderia ubonensis TaxID=101571 RepID=A0A103R5W1_9BURK|nr:hypothetical protein WJ32_01390 [Burkholderia ubonensis]KVG61800.1 hypothetical protein WJ33_30910 [Burkholderia ubonensis]